MKKKVGIALTIAGIALLAVALIQVYISEFNVMTSLGIMNDKETATATIAGLGLIIIGPRLTYDL